MKLGKLANKLWLIVGLVVVGATFCLPTVPISPLTASATTTYLAPSYQFSDEWYAELGVKDYNTYLQSLQSTSSLKTVTVAVIDSGLDYTCSPVFDGRVNTTYAKNFNYNDGLTAQDWYIDESGHGTHVAGIIAAGSMANVQILPLRIFNGINNNMSYTMFRDAVSYLVQYAKTLNVVAVNLSLGTVGITRDQAYFEDMRQSNLYAYQPYINKLRNAGILPVAAAGNIDTDAGETDTKSYYSFPAACEGVVAVSSYRHDNVKGVTRSPFSYYNERVTVSAPGSAIWSACSSSIAPDNFGDLVPSPSVGKDVYFYKSKVTDRSYYVRPHDADNDGVMDSYDVRLQGTSMATPFATLCYALLCSDPSKTDAEAFGVTWDTEVDTKAPYYYLNPQHKALLLNATDFGDAGNDIYFGYGGVNVSSFAKGEVKEQPSKSEEEVLSPSWPAYEPVYETDPEAESWANVFWVLCGIILIMVLIGFLRNWFDYRRKLKNESE